MTQSCLVRRVIAKQRKAMEITPKQSTQHQTTANHITAKHNTAEHINAAQHIAFLSPASSVSLVTAQQGTAMYTATQINATQREATQLNQNTSWQRHRIEQTTRLYRAS